MTLVAKIYQSQDFSRDDWPIFEASSSNISIKGFKSGAIKLKNKVVFNINNIGPPRDQQPEWIAVGLEVRLNEKPIPLVTERFL